MKVHSIFGAHMKTIHKGSSGRKPWIGKVIECYSCKFVGKLESKDRDRVRDKGYDCYNSYYEADCPNCGNNIPFYV